MTLKHNLSIIRAINQIKKLKSEYQNTSWFNPISKILIGIKHDKLVEKFKNYLIVTKLNDIGIEKL